MSTIFSNLHRCAQLADKILGETFQDLRITPRQYSVIRTIHDAPGLSQIGIVDATGIDRSTMVDICRRLERLHLVVRARPVNGGDGRCVHVELTGKGREIYMQARARIEDAEQAAREAIAGLDGLAIRETAKFQQAAE